MSRIIYLFLCVVIACLTLLGCSAGNIKGPGSGQQVSPSADVIPLPSELHATSYTAEDLYRLGREYRQNWANLNVEIMGGYDWLRFSPDWTRTARDPAGLAFGVYSFGLDGYDQETTLYLDFYEAREWDDVWIGLSNFDRDRWDWFQTAEDTPLNFAIDEPGRLHPDSSEMYVVILCTGTELWTLNDVRVGPVIAPTINDVSPIQLGVGQPVPMAADVDGSIPLSYSWDFGTAHAASTEESPLVTIFNPGEYDCQLTVLNSSGTDTYDFTLTVAEVDQWAHTWGGAANESAIDVAADATGNIYTVGLSASFNSCGVLKKYSQYGELLWAKRFDGDSSDRLDAVEIGPDQDIFVVGSTASFADRAEEILIARFNPDGSLEWARSWGGALSDLGTDLALDAAGNPVVMGTTYSYHSGEASFDSLVLLKLTATGSLTSGTLYTVDRNLGTFTGGVVVDSTGTTYVATGSTTFPGYVLKFNSAGNLVKQITYNGMDYTILSDIAMDSAGNIFASGYAHMMSLENQVVVVRFNTDLDIVWSRQWGMTSDYQEDYGNALTVDADDNLWFVAEADYVTHNPYCLMLGYVSNAGTTYGVRGWSITNEGSGGPGLREGGLGITWHPAGNPVMVGYSEHADGGWEAISDSGATLPAETTGVAPGLWEIMDLGTQGEFAVITEADISSLDSAVIDTGGGDDDALVIFGSPL